MKPLRAAVLLLALPLLAACSSASTGTDTVAEGTPAASAAVTSDSSSPEPVQPSPTAGDSGFAARMQALGFFTGTPADIVDVDGNAICGELQTQTYKQVIAYEQSVDETTLTGMTTDKDIATYVRYSVQAFCKQYAAQLPAQ